MMTGAVGSITVTTVTQFVERPPASVTMLVTKLGPMFKAVPGTGLWVNVTQQQLSVATTSLRRSARSGWQFVVMMMERLGGHVVMTGGCGTASLIATSTRPVVRPPT